MSFVFHSRIVRRLAAGGLARGLLGAGHGDGVLGVCGGEWWVELLARAFRGERYHKAGGRNRQLFRIRVLHVARKCTRLWARCDLDFGE